MSDSVSMEGSFLNLIADMEKMGHDLDALEAEATKEGAEITASALKSNTPRSNISKAGYKHMQDSVKVSGLKENSVTGDKARDIGFGKLQYKAKWQEFGRSGQSATHFLTKTVEETKNQVKNAIDNKIKQKLGL